MRTLTVLALVLSTIAVGCGGGGGDSGPDLNGWWEFAVHEVGSPDPYDFAFFGPAAHAGSRFVYLGMDWVFNGTTLTTAEPDFVAPRRTEYHLTAQGGNLFLGQVHAYRPGDPVAYRDVRLRRVAAPSGTLTAEGTFGGEALDLLSSTAYADVEHVLSLGDTETYRVRIFDAAPGSANVLHFQVTLPRFLIFPYETDVPEPCDLGLARDEVAYMATDGAVQFTGFVAGERIRGTFQVIFGLDGTAQGTFDVPVWDLR